MKTGNKQKNCWVNFVCLSSYFTIWSEL